MTATAFPDDAVRPWCVLCAQHRVEKVDGYYCPLCAPGQPVAVPWQRSAVAWLDDFQATWAGLGGAA